MIYLDANATTPLLPKVLEAMLPWLRDGFSNPSGAYTSAKLARTAIDQAREEVAKMIHAQPGEIIFTGGGTESVNTALHSLNHQAGSGVALVSAIEHSAVLRCVENLKRDVRLAPVTPDGRVNLVAFSKMLEGAAYVSVMAANNETGVIQPLREIVTMAHERGIPVHTDAIQAAGKTHLDVKELGVDLLSISAHKFHGPKGVGALYVREGLKFIPLLHGGAQESGRRSGTENTAGIVGMGAAAAATRNTSLEILTAMRDAFEEKICSSTTGVFTNGNRNHRLPNTSHLSFDGCDASGLLILLDQAGVACSAGSACMTGKQKPSHVQLAMGISEALAKSSLRISFSRLNTLEESLNAAEILRKSVEKLRSVQGYGVGPVVIYSA
ncbi:MAG: cysteine desulfurase [Akkermansiaceae bacterium]|nr:cysteine desulfurase [Akkermansiaceae bacterium]